MKNTLSTGIYDYLPIDEYHADRAVGSTSLKTIINKTPLHLRDGVRKESAALDYGQAFHMAILEPERFETHVIKGPDDKRGNKWKDAKEEADIKGHTLLTVGDYESCLDARTAAHKSPLVQRLCTAQATKEQSYFWLDGLTNTRCKARVDLYNPKENMIVDLKTCVSASPYTFSKAIADYGYHLQAAMYTHGVITLLDLKPDFIFIAVEKEPPYALAVYRLDSQTMVEGLQLFRHAIEKYALCRKCNDWPGYSEEIEDIQIPRHSFKMIDPATFPAMSGEAMFGGVKPEQIKE